MLLNGSHDLPLVCLGVNDGMSDGANWKLMLFSFYTKTLLKKRERKIYLCARFHHLAALGFCFERETLAFGSMLAIAQY